MTLDKHIYLWCILLSILLKQAPDERRLISLATVSDNTAKIKVRTYLTTKWYTPLKNLNQNWQSKLFLNKTWGSTRFRISNVQIPYFIISQSQLAIFFLSDRNLRNKFNNIFYVLTTFLRINWVEFAFLLNNLIQIHGYFWSFENIEFK